MKARVITTIRSHYFHLARGLHKHGLLSDIYSGYPKFKLRNEKNLKDKIETFPYFTSPLLFAQRYIKKFVDHTSYIHYLTHKIFSQYISNLNNSDHLIAMSLLGLEAGAAAQKKGKFWICDVPTTHKLFRNDIIEEEYKNYNLKFAKDSQKLIDREILEYEKSDFISVPSKFVYDTFVKHGFKNKLFLNPFGSAFVVDHRLNKKVNYEKFRVIFVGQVCLRKGIFYLIDAFKKFKHPNKELIIIGNIDSDIKNMFLKKLDSNIKYLGVVPHEMLKDYYLSSNVLVLPSIEEGFSLVLGEAMSCGCPVITTTNSGADQNIIDGEHGFIIPIRSSIDIFEKMQLLADDQQLQKKLSRNCLSYIDKIKGWDSYGDKWANFIRSLNN